MVVVITRDTEVWRREALERLGVILFEGSNPDSPMIASVDRWRTVLTNIHAFRLLHKRIVFMDTDMLLLQSLDVILESAITNKVITCNRDEVGQIIGAQMAATPELGCCDQAPFPFNETLERFKTNPLNSGMMVLCPHLEVFAGLEVLAHRGPRADPGGGDQVLFNDYFALDGLHPHGVLPVELSLTHGDVSGWEAHERGEENSVALHGNLWQDLNEADELRMQRAWRFRRVKMEGLFDWLPWERIAGMV